MRVALISALLLAMSACSSPNQPEAAPSEQASSPESATQSDDTAGAGSADACDILSQAEAESLLSSSTDGPQPGMTGSMPQCQWAAKDGSYVQVISLEASEWARLLPEVLRNLESSGLAAGAKNVKKIRRGAALVEGGGTLGPVEACSMFSTMAEWQGVPPGSSFVVNIVPTREEPLAVTAQICSSGRFTSVMVANPSGLEAPLPERPVLLASQKAHRRSTG